MLIPYFAVQRLNNGQPAANVELFVELMNLALALMHPHLDNQTFAVVAMRRVCGESLIGDVASNEDDCTKYWIDQVTAMHGRHRDPPPLSCASVTQLRRNCLTYTA